MSGMFKKAVREKKKVRIVFSGPPGAGKTFSALKCAAEFGGRTAVIDSEHGSAVLYADRWDYDHVQLPTFDPRVYMDYIHMAEKEGYDNIIVDSFTHAWAGKGGCLEIHEAIAQRPGENSYSAWRHVTPLHNALVDCMLASPCHIFITMRSHLEHAMETDAASGKTKVRKMGMGEVQRKDVGYEFDVTLAMDTSNRGVIEKTRCDPVHLRGLKMGEVFAQPGAEFAKILKDWLAIGAPATTATGTGYALDFERAGKIERLFVEAGYTTEQITLCLSKRSVSRVFSLPTDEADKIIEAFEKMLAPRRIAAQEVAAVSQPVAPQEVAAAVAPEPAPTPEPITVPAPPRDEPPKLAQMKAHAEACQASLAADPPAPALGTMPITPADLEETAQEHDEASKALAEMKAGLNELFESHGEVPTAGPVHDYTVPAATRPDRNGENGSTNADNGKSGKSKKKTS